MRNDWQQNNFKNEIYLHQHTHTYTCMLNPSTFPSSIHWNISLSKLLPRRWVEYCSRC